MNGQKATKILYKFVLEELSRMLISLLGFCHFSVFQACVTGLDFLKISCA